MISLSFSLTGCLAFDQSGGVSGPKAYNVNLYPANKLVCDPLNPGGGGDPGLGGGLKADLFYLESGREPYYTAEEYIQHGRKSEQILFFSELNVPTRLFTMGFPLEAGGMIQNDVGEDLIEYFGIRFSTILKLGPDDPEGTYELALLSDDGTTLKVREEDGVYRTYVDNDGDHPTRLGCGIRTINMTRDSEHLVQINYYQGPRYHISVIPLWRRVTSETPVEKECGKTGNEYWFDYNNNSQPTQKYLNLISRGWRPLSAENYEIPATYYMNPCVEGIRPTISNFSVVPDDGAMLATWETDIPATSQVRMIRESDGDDQITAADNVLRRNHSVRLTGLRSGESYYFQAVSISDSYGKAFSGFIRLSVP